MTKRFPLLAVMLLLVPTPARAQARELVDMQHDEPQLVIDAIRFVLARVRNPWGLFEKSRPICVSSAKSASICVRCRMTSRSVAQLQV